MTNRLNKRRGTQAAAALLIAVTGCARFSTVQSDTSYDEEGRPLRTITTRAQAWTCGTSKSTLANFKASQTDKTQSAAVGSLSQESSSTNVANNARAVTELIRELKFP